MAFQEGTLHQFILQIDHIDINVLLITLLPMTPNILENVVLEAEVEVLIEKKNQIKDN